MKPEMIGFLNKGIISKIDYMLFIFYKKGLLKKNARRLAIKEDRDNKGTHKETETLSVSIQVEPYRGTNPFCIRMMEFVQSNLSDELIGALVHGSLGNGDAIGYSDFDGLVIIRDEVLRNPIRLAQVAEKLMRAKKIMYECDPLQHHDWFILAECDLHNYQGEYFPIELFAHAKALATKGLTLQIIQKASGKIGCAPFQRLSSRLLRKFESKKPSRVFPLKGLLSECMLLPALFVQCKTGRGVYKKDSFQLIKAEMRPDDIKILEEISAIRTNWKIKMNKIQFIMLTSTNPLVRDLGKRISPRIPAHIRRKLDDSFYQNVMKMVRAMREAVLSER